MQLRHDYIYKPLKYRSLMDLARVHTTPRAIFVLALKSCPMQHQYISEDCFTFARDFSQGLLNYLQRSGLIGEEDNLEHQAELLHRIRATEGVTGDTEEESRES